MQNVMSGMGCERDQALAGGVRINTKYFNSGIECERGLFPLTLNEQFGHRDFVQGDLVSRNGKKIVPLDPAQQFLGVIEGIGQENGGEYTASVATRGAIVVKVRGVNFQTPTGAKVYATPGRTQTLSLTEGGVLVGELLAVESVEREMGIVGFRQQDDSRELWLGGPRPSRS